MTRKRYVFVVKYATNDVLKFSEIEDEFLNPEQVRSSIARRLGMEITVADWRKHNITSSLEGIDTNR